MNKLFKYKNVSAYKQSVSAVPRYSSSADAIATERSRAPLLQLRRLTCTVVMVVNNIVEDVYAASEVCDEERLVLGCKAIVVTAHVSGEECNR